MTYVDEVWGKIIFLGLFSILMRFGEKLFFWVCSPFCGFQVVVAEEVGGVVVEERKFHERICFVSISVLGLKIIEEEDEDQGF